MAIGRRFPTEWLTYSDPDTGRTIRQLTSAQANSYPLYYFIPSITRENDALIFHSERTAWVQLYKLDLHSGEIVQLSDGHTRDSGWAIWCEHHLRGIYNHLSALNQTRREVYYFQDEEIRATHIDTLENRVVHTMPGRIPVGQTGFSPDGRLFAFIHADRELFKQAIADREAIQNMRQPFDHEAWRRQVPTTIGVLDTETGAYREVIALDFHVHHVFFLDNQRLLVNHVEGENGMWTIRLDGSGRRELRPEAGHGKVCHQVVTERGLLYEANEWRDGRRKVWFGRYDLETDTYEEFLLPGVGYVHTGYDPAGRLYFIENQGDRHELLTIEHPGDPYEFRLKLLRRLSPIPRGQRFHAHPFLGPDRRWLYYTEVIDGFSQVCALDVQDLTQS
ncbi:oligogalacturonate lyase family protein [Litorilinea aerophila]|uniref:Oligogalacturonate lyase domain-containing protein n=1 Tax=Litorilinea aerophila TaxID=1204385 RepID=A0A540VHT0_9CHLR|nr:hypothetical protein [Litorilinea aerophila]MCC9076711.1 oligogalacturonate lyase family protein [Litorilinea aerophila]